MHQKTRERNRRIGGLLLATVLALGLWACSRGAEGQTGGEGIVGETGEGPGESPMGEEGKADRTGGTMEGGEGLRYLCEPGLSAACSTAEGYYYLTGAGSELRDGAYGSHLMYMDYASQKEVYLCSTAGCGHDTPDCPAVFLQEDFSPYEAMLFVYQDGLYLLQTHQDQSGTMSVDDSQGESLGEPEAKPSVLYRANLDGTNRRRVYTFDEDLTVEELVLGDERGIYLITKKVSMEREGNMSYGVSSQRRLVRLDPKKETLQEVCSLDFDDSISWNVVGCSKDSLVFSGIDYGRRLSREEYWDDDSHRELYLNSYEVYAVFDRNSQKLREVLRLANRRDHSAQVLGNVLYYSDGDSGRIRGIELTTGEERTLCQLPQSQILTVLGEFLCCRDWDLIADFTYYFVDTRTGEVSHSSLVNLCNGWDLDFKADLGEDVLVVYDYDAKANGDGSYEINREQFGLISKEDLLAGRDNYRKIEMIESGM